MSKSRSQVKQAPPAAKGAFDAKKYAQGGVSEEEVVQVKAAFDLFDTDQGGSVDINGKSPLS